METIFECKILGDNYIYTGEKGMQRFVTEKYGFPDMPFYGMLGYIKDDLAIDKQEKLQKSIEKKKKDLNLTGQEVLENSDSQAIFRTRHRTININKKKRCNANIEITHILHSWE